jgi:hypothetical protein
MHSRRVFVPLGAVLSLALAAAGCGGGSGAPRVASVPDGGTTTTAAAGAPAGSGPSTSSGSGSGSGPTIMMQTRNGLKFSQCMRAHGVSNFPDPNGQGEIQIGPATGIDPQTSTFQAAQQACQKVVGGGKPPSPAEQAKFKQQALAFSACMRRHGIHDFPDPVFSAGRVGIHINGGPGSDVNPSSPIFQAAMRTCQGLLPGKLPGRGVTAHAAG